MNEGTRTAAGIAVVVVLAVGFWVALLGPKRDEADELSEKAATVSAAVDAERGRVAQGLAAKRRFPLDYQELVVLGKAIPRDDDTASLLVQLNRLGDDSDTRFVAIKRVSGQSGAVAAEGSEQPLPIGAAVGSAGLPALPYELSFTGGFFDVIDFIAGVDSQVRTVDGRVVADGRLITIDGFSLVPEDGNLAQGLNAEFKVTTYVTPPGEGLTGGATAAGPSGSTP